MTKHIKANIFGEPKEAGKTTLALLLAPKGRNLVLQYDAGSCFPPPVVDQEKLTVQRYPAADVDFSEKSTLLGMIPPTNIGHAIMRDAVEVSKAFYEKRQITLLDHFDKDAPARVIDLPDTLILDGGVTLDQHFRNTLLGEKRLTNIADWPDPGNSAKKNPQNFWDKRQEVLSRYFDLLLPLPCNVIFITWSGEEMVYSEKTGKMEKTGNIQPAIGGKMDTKLPGSVDASVYCYSDGGRFHVQMLSVDKIKATAVRGRFGDGKTMPVVRLDITLDAKGVKDPWKEILKG